MKQAFTFIEVMIVITLMALMLGLSLLYSQTSVVRSDLNAQRNNLISSLRLAQSDAASGKSSSDYGVHIESSSYTTFTGTSYVLDDAGNFVFELPTTLEFININLNGSGNDIVFTSPKGETDQYGTVEVNSEQLNQSSVITINQFGVITY